MMPQRENQNTALIIMGVSGVGKSTIARALAQRIHAHYVEADDFHPQENIDAMQNGIPLTDAMRFPWLVDLSNAVEEIRNSQNVVLACSVLKRSYRDIINQHIGKTQIIYLAGSRDLIAGRLSARTDHVMPTTLLDSQFATLEVPSADENAIEIDISGAPEDILDQIYNVITSDDSTVNL
jgi:gluconokinase